MSYPNEHCHPCTPVPPVEVTPPPTCEGESCAEIYPTLCVKYNGPDISEFNIVEGINMNEIITIFSEFLLLCPAVVEFTLLSTECDSILVTITNPTTTVDLYQIDYQETSNPGWVHVTGVVSGDTAVLIEGLNASTSYDIRVRKVCGPSCYSGYTTDVVVTPACA